MVYSRYVEDYGPYLYKSERIGETVKSIYLGKGQIGLRKRTAYTTLTEERFKPQEKPQETPAGLGSGPIAAPKPEKKKIFLEHKTKEETRLNNVQRVHLLALANKYGIDRAEIDHKLTYEENKEILEKMAKENANSNQDLDRAKLEAEQWKGAYQDFIKDTEEDSEKWKDYF